MHESLLLMFLFLGLCFKRGALSLDPAASSGNRRDSLASSARVKTLYLAESLAHSVLAFERRKDLLFKSFSIAADKHSIYGGIRPMIELTRLNGNHLVIT